MASIAIARASTSSRARATTTRSKSPSSTPPPSPARRTRARASIIDDARAVASIGSATPKRRRRAPTRGDVAAAHRATAAEASAATPSPSETSATSSIVTLLVAGVASVGCIAATHAARGPHARAIGSMALGLLLALVGYKKKSLDESGALAAIGVGFGSIYADVRFGAALAAFFFASSAVTRVRSDVKKRVDEHFKVGGGRDWVQVFANGFVPTVIALAFASGGFGAEATSALASAYLGYYACCGGDTFASELGVLSKSKPRLIIDWRREVAAGTNGGVTALGWVASASGGAVVGAAFHLGQSALRAVATDGGALVAPSNAASVIAFGAVAGVFGSLVDSVLGATIQYSGFCEERQKVVSKPGPTVTRISGSEFLSNSAVNLVSGVITAVVAAWLSPLL